MSSRNHDALSRREFARGLANLLFYGGLVHFSLLRTSIAGPADVPSVCPGGRNDKDLCMALVNARGRQTESDECPGGGPSEDVCRPAQGSSDECPGEQMPEDECSPSGARKFEGGEEDDYCDTGLPRADICAPGVLCPKINGEGRSNGVESPDQCPAQNASTDLCDSGQTSKFDYCRTGLPADDECAPDGGIETDECPGGGVLRDTCAAPDELWGKGTGDECSPENRPESQDSCKTDEDRKIFGAEVADYCGFDFKKAAEASDVCYEGTNDTFSPVGGGDLCIATLPVGDASDDCHDGSADQDYCGVWNGEGYKENDVCIVAEHGESEDLCNPSLSDPKYGDIGTDDICFQGLSSSDECKPELGDKDECPGGISNVDECDTGLPDEDECPGGLLEGDVCFAWRPESDECVTSGAVSNRDSEPPDGCMAGDLVE